MVSGISVPVISLQALLEMINLLMMTFVGYAKYAYPGVRAFAYRL